MKVAIVGYGVVGQAYSQLFPEALIYDPFKPEGTATKEEVNQCDIALVAVWTAGKEDGQLDMSIVEETIDWLETPLILIKSALHPGTVDRLVEKTGKNIAVSVEFIGEGNYPVHFWKYPDQHDPRKHAMLIVGGEEKVATACAEVMWSRMSPDIKIHITTALEAEMVKLIENSYGAFKVTFMNSVLTLAQKTDTNFIRIHQAWQSDSRVDSMHLRAVSFNRGWASKCWDKDVPALVAYARSVGADDLATLFETIIDLNKKHLNENAISD
jgi:UDP-glucose 6-dehydrogenase